jgi:hypothetical protein
MGMEAPRRIGYHPGMKTKTKVRAGITGDSKTIVGG